MDRFVKVVVIVIVFLIGSAGIWGLGNQITGLKRDLQASENQFQKVVIDFNGRFNKLSSENRGIEQKMEIFVTTANFEQILNQKVDETLRKIASDEEDFETFRTKLAEELFSITTQLQKNGKELESLKATQKMLWDLTDGQYDRIAFARPQDISRIRTSLVALEIQTVFEKTFSLDGKNEVSLSVTDQSFAIGVAISPNKILTTWRVSNISARGWKAVAQQILVYGHKSQITLQDPKNDLLIISAPDGVVLSPISIPIGKPGELKDGDMVWLFGFLSEEEVIRPGFVASSNLVNAKMLGDFLKIIAPARPKTGVFMVDIQIDIADRGGIVIAFRDGSPELVGIVEESFGPLAIIASIDYFVSEIKKFQ